MPTVAAGRLFQNTSTLSITKVQQYYPNTPSFMIGRRVQCRNSHFIWLRNIPARILLFWLSLFPFSFLNLSSWKSEDKWMVMSSEAEAGITTENKTYCFSNPWEAREHICIVWVKGYDVQPHKLHTRAGCSHKQDGSTDKWVLSLWYISLWII